MKAWAVSLVRKLRGKTDFFLKILPIFAFVVPMLILYFTENIAYPYYPNTFEMTWKGRTFYLFFIWLIFLEIALNWEDLQLQRLKQSGPKKKLAFALALLFPTIYTVISNFSWPSLLTLNPLLPSTAGGGTFNFGGLNVLIVKWVWSYITFRDWMPLAIEYFVFGVSFAVIAATQYGLAGLKKFVVSPFFMIAVGTIYTIDNAYPYGYFTPFQAMVPLTANLSASVLNLLGYQTKWGGTALGTPILTAWNSEGIASFGIAWPCAGIESLLIYTVVIALFLRNNPMPLWQKAVYFLFGAFVTYFLNVLRIVTIFLIGIHNGNWMLFHNYYGALYGASWIISYPLIIVGSQALVRRIRPPKAQSASPTEAVSGMKASPSDAT